MVLEIKVHGNITHEQAPSIKLIKGQKDTYGWEIKVFEKNTEKALEQLKKLNDELVEQYCRGEGNE